ncbi:MAG: hypothetical protein GY859_04820 [Desulfobacterales bacterium]|nr:hypothetical protein [Desulfobacterales bacterium]
MAVDEKTGKGALIRVSARVGDDIKKEGSVKIVGSQVEGRTRNGFGYRTTPPLQLLGERLRERFKAPAIAPLALHKRDVYIEIENMDYLTRSRSLMLSVIAAVIKASVKETGFEDLVYSADVDLDGRVQGVGRIADKAEFVLSEGSLRFASASDDLHGIPAHLRESHAEDMVSFHDLSDLLKYLHVRLTAAKTDDAAARAPRSGTKIFGPVRTPILLLALIASGLMAFLGFITGNYYATADLMTLFHLKSGHGALIGWARILNPALWIFLIAWLSVRCIHIFTAFISRGGKTPFLPGLSRVKRYPVVQIVVLLSLIYFGFNLHIFVETSPDNFKSYERIEYLIHDKTFRDVARDVPNHRYMEFEKLAAGRGADELEKGLTIGLGIRPSDPVFKKAFVRMTGMLMDSVNNVVYARRLLESYIQFTDSIRDNPNAKQWAADTIDAAEDLMNRYKLKETFYGEKRFGSLIGEVVSRYGL